MHYAVAGGPSRPSGAQALLTDLYELTMAYGYWKTGKADQEAAYVALRRAVLDYDRRQGYRGPEGYAELPAAPEDDDLEEALFGEGVGRFVVAGTADVVARVVGKAGREGVDADVIGTAGGDEIRLRVGDTAVEP